jgi:uncharacterized protein (TIGR02453 family)
VAPARTAPAKRAPAKRAPAKEPPTPPRRSRAGGGFRGWTPKATEFFDRLELDNTKGFWAAHKDFYEESVLAPMQALLAELAPEFGEGRVFRPYRDTRFSNDKSPYKTNIAAHNSGGYISLNADALGVGSGLHMPSGDQLAHFRAAVADDRTGKQLVAVVAELRRRHISVSAHEVLKSTPRGYPGDHPRIELLRHKGLTGWKEWPVGSWLATPTARRRIVDVLRATAPLRKWLDQNVGAAEGS